MVLYEWQISMLELYRTCIRAVKVVRCAGDVTDEFEVEVGLYQQSALNPFMFAEVMDRLTDVVKQESQ